MRRTCIIDTGYRPSAVRRGSAKPALAIAVVFSVCGCDSILSDRCEPPYTFDGTACVLASTGGSGMPDAGHDPIAVDAPPPLACSQDLQADPLNCGVCGDVCASGVCSAGVCLGTIPGQIVAIGHDYSSANPAMVRVLGDAIAMGQGSQLVVMRIYDGDVPSHAITAAIDSAAAQVGRTWRAAYAPAQPSADAFDKATVVLVEPRQGDGASLASQGSAWAPAFASFIARSGIVIVLESATSLSYVYAGAAGLYTVSAPVSITGQLVTVTSVTDAVTQQVVSPYLADSSSVSFPGGSGGVIETSGSVPVVMHLP